MGTTQGSALAGTDTLVIANLTEATFGTYTCVVSINGHTVEDTHFIGIIAGIYLNSVPFQRLKPYDTYVYKHVSKILFFVA